MKPNRLHHMSARALCFALSLFLWSAAQGQPKPAEAPRRRGGRDGDDRFAGDARRL